MAKSRSKNDAKKTTVGHIDQDVLDFTAGQDIRLDGALVEADCCGSAAHVTMLSKIPVKPRLFSVEERKKVVAGLVEIMQQARQGKFKITLEDQDVHLAIERALTKKLGVLGKRVHTGRSRNDQVATALRLYSKQELIDAVREASDLAASLFAFAGKHEKKPMVGRTHLQPAMPGSVGLWAAAYGESILEDVVMLINAYQLNDQSPLGAAASYGAPLPLDREMTSELLGFSKPCHTVLYAVMARGKIESIILSALSQVMISLSRLAEDLILFAMPEFGYFRLPSEYCTGSSIMPQKQNPDVLELIRAKTARQLGDTTAVLGIIKSLAFGYNRDLQETKEPLMNGIATTRASLRIMKRFIDGLSVNTEALLKGFTPDVFATDRALQLVAEGMPFRDAYQYVKENLHELEQMDPAKAIACKTSLGDTGRLELGILKDRAREGIRWSRDEQRMFDKARTRLMGTRFPL